MLFNSYAFLLVFLPVTWAVFRGLTAAGRGNWAILWLVLASFFFYGWWNPIYVFLLAGSVAFNFGLGSILALYPQTRKVTRHAVLTFGVAFNLVLLGYFKYANFFADTANQLWGTDAVFPGILLPLAISFFTFQQIAYLVDAAHDEDHEPLNRAHANLRLHDPRVSEGESDPTAPECDERTRPTPRPLRDRRYGRRC